MCGRGLYSGGSAHGPGLCLVGVFASLVVDCLINSIYNVACHRINGVVVTWVVAIDPPGVRFPLNAVRERRPVFCLLELAME